ncbi:MAG: HEAT repeat domain-containing protein [Planctomycetes bacterium]|nr:HEAT repeat domain-containing protein [Planctomycetota bacterium]
MTEDRIRRVLAAKYLACIAYDSSSLIPNVLAISKAWIRTELDREVRFQLIAGLGGLPLKASAGSLLDGETRRWRVVEGFSNVRRMDGQRFELPWQGSLRRSAAHDPEILDLLAEIAGSPQDRGRLAALPVLAEMDTDSSRKIVLDLFRSDPGTRFWSVEGLCWSGRPEVLRVFVEVLPTERDPLVVNQMVDAIRKADPVPEGAGAALLGTFRNLAARENDLCERARGRVLSAAQRTFEATRDASAAECIVLGLGDSSDSVRRSAVRVIAQHPDGAFIAPLWKALGDARDEYGRELVRYALRHTDPTFQGPSLLWDIERIEKQLKDKGLSAEARQALERDLRARKDELARMARR